MKKKIMMMMLAGLLLLTACESNVSMASTSLPTLAGEHSETTSSLQTAQTTTSIETTWQSETTTESLTAPLQTTQQLIALKDTEVLIPVQTTETTQITQTESETTQTVCPTETTETTCVSATTAVVNPVSQERPESSREVDFPEGIVLCDINEFVETPSEIIFFQNGVSYWDGRGYTMKESVGMGYFSKEDGSVDVYCRDPRCDHRICAQRTFWLDDSHFVNDRFYCYDEDYEGRTVVRSFHVDEAGVRFEWDSAVHPEIETGKWVSTFGYGDYLFITVKRADNSTHLLRYDTQSGIMEDLTEKTGCYLAIRFAYNGMLYGVCADHDNMVKADLSLKTITEAEAYVQKAFGSENENGKSVRYIREVTNGDRMYGTLLTTKANGEKEYCIQVLDMKAGEVFYITEEMLGYTFREILFVDDTYIYFTVKSPVLVGEIALLDEQYYNHSGGKLYRARLDGSDAICIFEDAAISFDSSLWLYVCGDELLVWASKLEMMDWELVRYAQGVYIGHMNEDGVVEHLSFLEIPR